MHSQRRRHLGPFASRSGLCRATTHHQHTHRLLLRLRSLTPPSLPLPLSLPPTLPSTLARAPALSPPVQWLINLPPEHWCRRYVWRLATGGRADVASCVTSMERRKAGMEPRSEDDWCRRCTRAAETSRWPVECSQLATSSRYQQQAWAACARRGFAPSANSARRVEPKAKRPASMQARPMALWSGTAATARRGAKPKLESV